MNALEVSDLRRDAVIPTATRCSDLNLLYGHLGRGPHKCPACHENGKWRQRTYKEQRPKMRALVDGPWRLIEPDPLSEVGYRLHACSAAQVEGKKSSRRPWGRVRGLLTGSPGLSPAYPPSFQHPWPGPLAGARPAPNRPLTRALPQSYSPVGRLEEDT